MDTKETLYTVNDSALNYYVQDGIVDTSNHGWINFQIKTRNILQKRRVILS